MTWNCDKWHVLQVIPLDWRALLMPSGKKLQKGGLCAGRAIVFSEQNIIISTVLGPKWGGEEPEQCKAGPSGIAFNIIFCASASQPSGPWNKKNVYCRIAAQLPVLAGWAFSWAYHRLFNSTDIQCWNLLTRYSCSADCKILEIPWTFNKSG